MCTGYFELQAKIKKVSNVDFSRILGFHKSLFIKSSFRYPNVPNSN